MKPQHRNIIAEIMAGGRVMPPLAERKRIRDAILNERQPVKTEAAPAPTSTAESDRGYTTTKNGWSGD